MQPSVVAATVSWQTVTRPRETFSHRASRYGKQSVATGFVSFRFDLTFAKSRLFRDALYLRLETGKHCPRLMLPLPA